jgi:hypothetical protein
MDFFGVARPNRGSSNLLVDTESLVAKLKLKSDPVGYVGRSRSSATQAGHYCPDLL